MNVRDSEWVAGLLIDGGFALAESEENADVVIFNSCSVRKHAEERLFSNINELKELKAKKPGLVMALMGCVAQHLGHNALGRAPILDLVVGPGNEADLPSLIEEVLEQRRHIIATDKVNDERPRAVPEYREGAFKAQVSIGEGCGNYCSYCIVPYVRGRERSRDAKDIMREVQDLAARGFKEILLLGQNVNSYGKVSGSRCQVSGFVGLLEKINAIKGIERIRFMTSHPKDANADLFKAMRDLEKVCEHLHLPLQSGSDRILKLMNRGYTAKKYLKLIEDYKKLVPEGSITTDIIAGFPSETESDFIKTCDIMEEAGFDSAFTFKYSPRPPAKSATLKDDVPQEAKDRRLRAVNDLQCRLSQKRNEAMVGKEAEVLVDGTSKRDPAFISGRTRTNKTTVFEGNKDLIGKFVKIKIGSVSPYALKGRMIDD